MGCSNSVATEVSIVRPPSPISNSNQSRLDDDTVKSLTQTIRQIQRQQIVAQRKVTQSSLGFFTIPEEAIRTGSQPSSKEENFSSGLVFKDVADIASDPSKLFNIIKRGEVAQFYAFVGQYFHNCEATLHSLRGMWDSSPLLVAVQYGQFEIAHFLLDHPPEDIDELNRRNEKGCTVALYAVMEGNVDLVKRLIGFNVKMNIEPTSEAVYNQKYDQSMVATPLLMAVVNNHRRILGLLIDCGCNVDEVFPFPTVKSIRKGFNTAGNAKSTGVTGMRPILLACAYGHDDIVRELIWRVCDFHAKDDEQSNVLHHLARAAANSSKSQDSGSGSGNNSLGSIADVFRFLQSKSCVDDALLTGFDENGDTPLHVACDLKMHEYAQLLLDDGADASKLNPISGFTPLHISIRRRDQEMVTILLEYGANPLRKDEKGNPVNKLTPLEMASKLPAESEIGKAVNEAAAAWSNMRQPMLRKSIINLFPDAQPAEHIAMGHAQETVVHVHKKKSPVKQAAAAASAAAAAATAAGTAAAADDATQLAVDSKVPFASPTAEEEETVVVAVEKTGDEVEEFVPLDDSVVVEADVVQEALAELDGTVTTKESDESDDATGPLNDDGAAAAFAAADADEATSQKLTKVPPLGGSVELDLASEQDAEESISIRIAASDAFEQALAFMEEFVQDTYAAESDQPSVPAATAEGPRPTATQQGTSTTAPTLRPTPPPPQSSKAAPSMSAEALAGLPSNPSDPSALNSSSTSNTPSSVAPKATATTTTGGTGNLRRRSLKPTAESSAKSNDGGATANETRDAAFVAKPPLSKKNSFQGSSRTSAAATASRRPSVSKTPNK